MTYPTSTRPQMGDEELRELFQNVLVERHGEGLAETFLAALRPHWDDILAAMSRVRASLPPAGSTGEVERFARQVIAALKARQEEWKRVDGAKEEVYRWAIQHVQETLSVYEPSPSTPAQSGLEDALNPSHRRWTERKFRNAHTIDIIVRKDAQEYRYEGDFLKGVARIIAPEISE